MKYKNLHDKRIELIKDTLSKKIDFFKKKVSVKLVKNDECVKKLCSLRGKEDYHKKYFYEAILDYFTQCTIPFLQIFTVVRNPAYKTASKLPKK